MPNPLNKLPAKAGRTAPSSRVKKKVKSGNKKFIGPRKFKDELAEDQTARHRDRIEKFVLDETSEPTPLSKDAQKRITAEVGERRFLDDGSSGQQALRGLKKRRTPILRITNSDDPYEDPKGNLQSARLKRKLLIQKKKRNMAKSNDIPF